MSDYYIPLYGFHTSDVRFGKRMKRILKQFSQFHPHAELNTLLDLCKLAESLKHRPNLVSVGEMERVKTVISGSHFG